MQELIIQNPELYSLVVLYAKEPSLLLFCKDSYQVIMQCRLYNMIVQNLEYTLYGGGIAFQLNLRSQLHGICVINFDFGCIVITYHENQLIEIRLNDVILQLQELQGSIFELVKNYPNVEMGLNCIYYRDRYISFHKNGAIDFYCSEQCYQYYSGFGFRDDFSLLYNRDMDGKTDNYRGNNTYSCKN